MVRVALCRARWGKSLLSSGKDEKGRQELGRALQEVEAMRNRSPGRGGVTKLHIEVLLSRARGLARAVAREPNASAGADLQQARDDLAAANEWIGKLPAGSELLTRDHWEKARQLIQQTSPQ